MGGGVRLSLLKSLYRRSSSSSSSCTPLSRRPFSRLAADEYVRPVVTSSQVLSGFGKKKEACAHSFGFGYPLNAKPFHYSTPLFARASFSSQPDDWVHKAKDVFNETANKAREASDELTPHVQQLLDSNPYLKDVMVPVSLTMTATLFAWVVMPKVLRRFHTYAIHSSSALLPQAFSIHHDVPYDKSFWGALEDPARYLMTFISFAQMLAAQL